MGSIRVPIPPSRLLAFAMTINQLSEICQANGLSLDAEQLSQLEQYAALLLEWNAKVNLISRKDEENVIAKHLLHSLALAMPTVCVLPPGPCKVLDIGTGGGMPGIPLKIARPEYEVLLLDSIAKKINACEDMITRLGLAGIRTRVGRAEEQWKNNLGKTFEIVVSRAVAPLDDLVAFTSRLVKPGAVLYSLKGGNLSMELDRTRLMGNVLALSVKPVKLIGFDEFEREEKKLVRVEFY